MKRRIKKTKKKDSTGVRVKMHVHDMLKQLRRGYGGKLSDSDLIEKALRNMLPHEQLGKAIKNLTDVCRAHYDPDTDIFRFAEHIRLLMQKSVDGKYDLKAVDEAIVELIESQIKSQTERKQVQPTHAPSIKGTDVRSACATAGYGSKKGTPKPKPTPEMSEEELGRRAEAKRKRLHEERKPRHDPI